MTCAAYGLPAGPRYQLAAAVGTSSVHDASTPSTDRPLIRTNKRRTVVREGDVSAFTPGANLKSHLVNTSLLTIRQKNSNHPAKKPTLLQTYNPIITLHVSGRGERAYSNALTDSSNENLSVTSWATGTRPAAVSSIAVG